MHRCVDPLEGGGVMLVDAEMRQYVVVMDVCSSTQILETLTRMENAEEYYKLMMRIYKAVERATMNKGSIYKFLGDGFILLFNSEYEFDKILSCVGNICQASNTELTRFVSSKLDRPVLKRMGITVGIDEGMIYQMDFNDTMGIEYFGMPINRASRLQASLKDPGHANKALISWKLYSKILDKRIRACTKETTRTFHNVAEDTTLRCYEIDLITMLSSTTEAKS
jgi:class 3 adenylate cyclase